MNHKKKNHLLTLRISLEFIMKKKKKKVRLTKQDVHGAK